jgi:hypothetical protein
MSWNDALQYAKGMAAKHGMAAAAPQDRGLPLGARIGGLITMQKSPFIRAVSNGSLVDMPTDADTLIKAIGRVNLNMSGSLYRYYVATGDDGSSEKFLQLYVDAGGQVNELMYCTRLARIFPASADDQEAFMGTSGYGLGDKTYTLWREQLAALGFGAADLQAAFGDQPGLEYQRDAGNPMSEFVTPFTGSETRLDDAAGSHGLLQDIYFMPYKRQIGQIDGSLEYLLITTEIVTSQDGDTARREIHVDFMIGIPVEADRVQIQ